MEKKETLKNVSHLKITSTGTWNNFSYEDKIKWIKDNPHICLHPFQTHQMQVEFDGQRNPQLQKALFKHTCCCSVVGNSSIEQIASNVTQGQLGAECQQCVDSEATTGTSERTLSLMNTAEDVVNTFLETGEVNSHHYKIKFSNLCNLACKTCSPTFSSKYATTHTLTVPVQLNKDISLNNNHWHLITKHILASADKKKHITVTLLGGESLIQPGAIKLINWIVENNIQASLSITTNLTKLNSDIIDALAHFENVTVAASIDSVGENYEYIRWPAKFADVEENIAKLVNIPNVTMIVQPVWSLHNIFYINEILDWWSNWFTKNKALQIVNVAMYRPQHMTVESLPPQYRLYLLEILERAISHKVFDNNNNSVLKYYINELISFFQTDRVVHDQFELFLYDTAKQDQKTKGNMKFGNSKLYRILSSSHRLMLDRHPNLHLLPLQQKNLYQTGLPL